MRDYKGWSATERQASLKKTKAAIAAGIIPPPTECNRCGKTTGRIDYHNHDYSDPIKHLEQLCQGCHISLHRLENKEMDGKREIARKGNNNQQTIAIEKIVTKSYAVKEVVNNSSVSEIRDEMHGIRVAFAKALGLDWPAENPNPTTGYKFEFNTSKRQLLLDDVRELRNKYAELVAVSGKGKDILEKMDRNFANKDRQAIWK